MRSRITALLALLLASCGGNPAPAPATPAPPAATAAPETAEPAPRGPFLYRYQGKTGPVYLLGTIHMMVSAKTDLDPVVWDSFTASSKLVLELDPTDVGVFGALLKMLDLEGPGLKEQLTDEEWTKLTGIVKQVPPNVLNKLRPWAVSMLLELANVTDTSKSMELEMVAHAKEHQVPVAALETVDDQLAALAGSSGLEDLKKAIAEHGESGSALTALVEAYKAGDLEAFEQAFAVEDPDADPGKMDKLLKDRNEKWVPQIETILAEEGNVFIAVGAGHLYGEHGLLTLLEARGHRAERVLGGGDAASKPQAAYLGAMRSAPSRRMTSPLR